MSLVNVIPQSTNLFPYPNVIANTKDMPLDEWRKLRKPFLGGSDAAPASGMSRYGSPVTVYYDKTEDLPDRGDSERMEAGRRMEPIIAHWFAEKSGKKVVQQPFFYQHPVHTWMGANIDFAIEGENAIVEIKNTTNDKDFADGLVPDEYYLQAMHYLIVTNASRCYLVYLLHGWKLEWVIIERDEDIMNTLIEKESRLWNEHIIPRIPPQFDGSDAAKELLKRMYPREQGNDPIDLPDDIDDLWMEKQEIAKQIKQLDTRQTEIENQIKAMLADNALGFTGGRIYTYTTTERKGFTVEPTSFRTLRSKVRKEKQA